MYAFNRGNNRNKAVKLGYVLDFVSTLLVCVVLIYVILCHKENVFLTYLILSLCVFYLIVLYFYVIISLDSFTIFFL